MFMLNALAQITPPVHPLYIEGRLPDLIFNNVIKYKDSSATLSDFQKNHTKLVIFDFWFTHCSACIAQFPKLHTLQKLFNNKIQIVLVAHESKKVVTAFIDKWQRRHHTRFRLPIITGDSILHRYIRHYSESHYAWVTPDNVLVAQTASFFLNKEILKGYLKYMPEEIQNRGFLSYPISTNNPDSLKK